MRFSLSVLSFLFLGMANGQWSKCLVPHARTSNSLYIFNQQEALLAGGSEYNDSIRSVIRTSDQAASWLTLVDLPSTPWLKSISFGSAATGYAVGYDGSVIKSTNGGNTWIDLTLPGNVASRQYNSVYFINATTGYIAGGYKSDDSIQTILKTTDGGNNWSVQRDILGYWLNAIYFTDANNGIAVGDHGTILKTINGGNNWTPVTITGNIASRNFNALTFIDATTGFIAGGNKANDSIQTLLKTTDGGSNWNIVFDNLGYMLNGIDFATASTGYAVGDYGTLLTSTDAGLTWNDVGLSDTINDTMAFYCVNFINADFGLAGGRRGKLLKFVNAVTTIPSVTTLPATLVNSYSAQLNAAVNANSSKTGIRFEYGLTPSLGSTIVAVPDSITGNSAQLVYAQLNGLIPNTFYYYRAIAGSQAGQISGQVTQFYTTVCEIPNCDFEVWDTAYFSKPSRWNFMGNIRRVPSYDASAAVQLSDTNSTSGGLVLLGGTGDDGVSGGIPCSVRPDSIVFYARYDIVAGDSAFAIIFFKLNGVIFNDFRIPISGSSAGNFVRIAEPISFSNATVPDSVILGFLSTNIFASGNSGNPASILTVDNVSFPGTNVTIPNPGFEQWDTVTAISISGWGSRNFEDQVNSPVLVEKISDCVSGHFAARLNNFKKQVNLVTGSADDNWNVPAFAVGGRHLTLNLFLKYLQANNDTLTINLQMFLHDSAIGNATFIIDTPILSYTPMSFDINYINSTDIPDSATLIFSLNKANGPGVSYASIDNLSFDGFRVAAINELNLWNGTDNKNFVMYPNPASLAVTVGLNKFEKCRLEVFDSTGNLVYSNSLTGIETDLDVSGFADGIYLVKVSTAHEASTQKLAIIR